MKITNQESKTLLYGIKYCLEKGMDNEWMEGYLIQEIERLSKSHQGVASGTSCEHVPDNMDGIIKYLEEQIEICGNDMAMENEKNAFECALQKVNEHK